MTVDAVERLGCAAPAVHRKPIGSEHGGNLGTDSPQTQYADGPVTLVEDRMLAPLPLRLLTPIAVKVALEVQYAVACIVGDQFGHAGIAQLDDGHPLGQGGHIEKGVDTGSQINDAAGAGLF